MKTYENANYKPYGAGDQFCMDQYVEAGFEGNVLDELLKNGFTISETADFAGCYNLFDTKGNAVAQLVSKED